MYINIFLRSRKCNVSLFNRLLIFHEICKASSSLAPPAADNAASRMMAKMGWKEGSGLGSRGQGNTEALSVASVSAHGKTTGRIVGHGPSSSRVVMLQVCP